MTGVGEYHNLRCTTMHTVIIRSTGLSTAWGEVGGRGCRWVQNILQVLIGTHSSGEKKYRFEDTPGFINIESYRDNTEIRNCGLQMTTAPRRRNACTSIDIPTKVFFLFTANSLDCSLFLWLCCLVARMFFLLWLVCLLLHFQVHHISMVHSAMLLLFLTHLLFRILLRFGSLPLQSAS